MVAYHYGSNMIYGIPIKSRKGTTFEETWESTHKLFSQAGQATTTWVLDNETSKELREDFDNAKVNYQLVHPYKHMNN